MEVTVDNKMKIQHYCVKIVKFIPISIMFASFVSKHHATKEQTSRRLSNKEMTVSNQKERGISEQLQVPD